MTTTSLISIGEDFESVNINEVFNFSYNMQIFKQIIEAITKNQKGLSFKIENQIHEMNSNIDFKIEGYDLL